MPRRLDLPTLLMLLFPPLAWAGNSVVGRLMVGELPPLLLSQLRWLVALACLLPFTAATLWRRRAQLRGHGWSLVWKGLLGIACYNSMQYVALRTATPIEVCLLGSTSPVFIVVLGALLYREPAPAEAWWGAALSVLGAAVVVSGDVLGPGGGIAPTQGIGLMVAAVLIWCVYTWELRLRPLPLPPLAALAAQIAVGVLFIAPAAAWERWGQGQVAHWGPAELGAVAYAALPASLIAYVCWGSAVARTGARVPAYFGNLLPVFAAGLAWMFLGERIAPRQVAGAVLIFAGIWVALRQRPRLVEGA